MLRSTDDDDAKASPTPPSSGPSLTSGCPFSLSARPPLRRLRRSPRDSWTVVLGPFSSSCAGASAYKTSAGLTATATATPPRHESDLSLPALVRRQHARSILYRHRLHRIRAHSIPRPPLSTKLAYTRFRVHRAFPLHPLHRVHIEGSCTCETRTAHHCGVASPCIAWAPMSSTRPAPHQLSLLPSAHIRIATPTIH